MLSMGQWVLLSAGGQTFGGGHILLFYVVFYLRMEQSTSTYLAHQAAYPKSMQTQLQPSK